MSLTASETDNMQVKINSSDKQSKNGDEQIEGMSISDIPEFTDPAILAVREITKVRYTKEELINLRNVPLSKKKPDFLESTEGLPWIFGSERWPFDRKKSGSNEPSENNSGNNNSGASDHRRKNSGDPRERIRKENDGIVLSPQRRSFNSGCFVPASRVEPATRNNRPHSPLGPKNDSTHIGVREIQPSTRRIGSGRILRANGDFNDKSETAESDNYGNSFRGPRGPNNNDEKYERRNFGRDFDMGRDRDRENNKESRRGGRAFDRRKYSEREQEEPEWFSGGPMSQHDTIELRGFDDADKPGRKKISPSQMKRAKEWSKKKEELQSATQTKEDNDKLSTDRTSVPEAKVVVEVSDVGEEKDAGQKKESETKNNAETDGNSKVSSVMTDQSLNFDDILKCDTIPGLLSNIEIEYDGNTSKSRFSRWFKQESPEKHESRRSSLHEDSIIKNLLNDIGETNVVTNSVPGDSEAYFAPISPAGNNLGGVIGTGKRETSNSHVKRPVNLIEMLQMNNHQTGIQNAKQPLLGKILSLDELEAKIRKNAEAVGASQKPSSKPDEEMSAAFKKLLSQAQATSGHSTGPMNKTQPMSLLEMLKDSQQQDEAARLSNSGLMMGPASPHLHNSQQSHFASEIALHLQQVQMKQQQQKQQMEMFNKLINSTTSVSHHQMRTSPSLHDIGLQQQTRELLNRPEAQAILQGLKRGEITTQHLYQQLANPALQHRHREMLLTILKIQNTTAATPGYGPSPRVSPVPPHHHIFQQQQQQPQQLRVSPLPPNAYCVSPILATSPNTLTVPAMQQRIPSPRELQVHTQNILQRALIKKKLEEQQENYRKKQEMAFTPTSVLRKMTAEKDESKENKISSDKMQTGRPLTGMRPQPPQPQGNPQWYGNIKQPGRPIVKANNYQTQTPEQFFSQHQQHQQQQQQQRIFNQFQQQQLSSQQLQQRKTSTSNQFGGTSQPPTSSGGQQFNQSSQFHLTNQQFGQQLTQQQLRAQHQHRPNNSQNASSQQQPHHQQNQAQQGFQQQQPGAGVWQQILNNTQQPQRSNRNSNPTTRSENNDHSQTTNQLAQWFSSDLLERARGGELPSTAGLAQHVISLEEIERQAAPPVHN